jgi:hypothetical protein
MTREPAPAQAAGAAPHARHDGLVAVFIHAKRRQDGPSESRGHSQPEQTADKQDNTGGFGNPS